MDAEGKARLAIRTVLVTTRAAIAAHLRTGREELSRESAHRGLVLLRDLREASDRAGVSEDYEAAERELNGLAETPTVAIAVEAGKESARAATDPQAHEVPCEAR